MAKTKRKQVVPCLVAGYRVDAVPGEKYTLGQGGNCWGPIPLNEATDDMDTEGVFEAVPIIQPVAVLSTTVLPVDGMYEVKTVDPGRVDITGVPHYIGHPTTKAIVEKLGAVQAESKLFTGLEPGEAAVSFVLLCFMCPARALRLCRGGRLAGWLAPGVPLARVSPGGVPFGRFGI